VSHLLRRDIRRGGLLGKGSTEAPQCQYSPAADGLLEGVRARGGLHAPE